MNSALSQISARVASVIRGAGRCALSTEDIARAAHLDVLATSLAIVELELAGAITIRFVPGHGRVIEMVGAARPGLAA